MRGLFRSVLAFFTMGLTMLGCKGPTTDEGPDNSPFHAAFRVPGMT
jgi:hypothetical protein